MKLVWSVLREDAPQLPVRTPKQVYDYAMNYCYKPENMGQEVAFLLFLNSAGVIYGQHELAKGGLDAVVLDKRLVCKIAIDSMAHGIVVVHNHPTGNSAPSNADIEQTRGLKRALSAIGVSLLDHVIVGDKEFFSFSEDKLLRI